jgi:hypothetical protein
LIDAQYQSTVAERNSGHRECFSRYVAGVHVAGVVVRVVAELGGDCVLCVCKSQVAVLRKTAGGKCRNVREPEIYGVVEVVGEIAALTRIQNVHVHGS